MATLAPGRPVEAILGAPDSEKLSDALRPWRRRLAVQQILRWTGRGLIVGLLLAGILLLVSRFIPWTTVNYWAIGVGIACVFSALVAAIWYRPSLAATARLVDARLALHDRLSTAWELQSASSPLSVLQRRDALSHLSKYRPPTSVSLRPYRTPLILFGVVGIILALLVLLPNPMNAVLQQQAAFQARIAKQVAAIDLVRKTLHQQNVLTPEQLKQIDQILSDTQAKLQHAKNEADAQQILAQAQAKIAQLQDPNAANKAQAVAAASSALQGSSNASLQALAKALANSNTVEGRRQLAKALQDLAAQASKMTAAQRAQLAQQIEQAANATSQDPKLSAALHQLAKAIADGNQSDIADASNAVQAAANDAAATQAQASAIDQATQGLQQAANALAAATDGSNTGQGQGQNQNQGQGQGQGQNQNQGQGQGGAGHGSSGGNTGAGHQQGKDEQVFVPGKTGTGTSSQTTGGDNAVTPSGSSVPYSEVVKQYDQMAHDAIDNSNIPPDLKDLVHGYYNTLEGQQ